MALRLSDALRDHMLQTSSVEAALALGFLMIYSGSQPASANDGATGVRLATIAVDGGLVGLTFDAIVTTGTLPKAAAEVWKQDQQESIKAYGFLKDFSRIHIVKFEDLELILTLIKSSGAALLSSESIYIKPLNCGFCGMLSPLG